MAGVLIVRLLVSVASKTVLRIPATFIVSILDGKNGNTLSRFLDIGLSVGDVRKG